MATTRKGVPTDRGGPEGKPLTMDALVRVLREVRVTGQAPCRKSFHLKPPIFDRDSGVEQFVREFHDVATIAEWPAPMSDFYMYSYLNIYFLKI